MSTFIKTKMQEGFRKRGRPREDCVKRDLRKAEEEKSGEKMPTTETMEANYESSRTSDSG